MARNFTIGQVTKQNIRDAGDLQRTVKVIRERAAIDGGHPGIVSAIEEVPEGVFTGMVANARRSFASAKAGARGDMPEHEIPALPSNIITDYGKQLVGLTGAKGREAAAAFGVSTTNAKVGATVTDALKALPGGSFDAFASQGLASARALASGVFSDVAGAIGLPGDLSQASAAVGPMLGAAQALLSDRGELAGKVAGVAAGLGALAGPLGAVAGGLIGMGITELFGAEKEIDEPPRAPHHRAWESNETVGIKAVTPEWVLVEILRALRRTHTIYTIPIHLLRFVGDFTFTPADRGAWQKYWGDRASMISNNLPFGQTAAWRVGTWRDANTERWKTGFRPLPKDSTQLISETHADGVGRDTGRAFLYKDDTGENRYYFNYDVFADALGLWPTTLRTFGARLVELFAPGDKESRFTFFRPFSYMGWAEFIGATAYMRMGHAGGLERIGHEGWANVLDIALPNVRIPNYLVGDWNSATTTQLMKAGANPLVSGVAALARVTAELRVAMESRNPILDAGKNSSAKTEEAKGLAQIWRDNTLNNIVPAIKELLDRRREGEDRRSERKGVVPPQGFGRWLVPAALGAAVLGGGAWLSSRSKR